jgi:hypothetical protein
MPSAIIRDQLRPTIFDLDAHYHPDQRQIQRKNPYREKSKNADSVYI